MFLWRVHWRAQIKSCTSHEYTSLDEDRVYLEKRNLIVEQSNILEGISQCMTYHSVTQIIPKLDLCFMQYLVDMHI